MSEPDLKFESYNEELHGGLGGDDDNWTPQAERSADLRQGWQEYLESLLTNRERKILDLIRKGLEQVEISKKLGVSRAAVSKMLSKIHEKTQGLSTKGLIRPKPIPPGTLQTQEISLKARRRPKG